MHTKRRWFAFFCQFTKLKLVLPLRSGLWWACVGKSLATTIRNAYMALLQLCKSCRLHHMSNLVAPFSPTSTSPVRYCWVWGGPHVNISPNAVNPHCFEGNHWVVDKINYFVSGSVSFIFMVWICFPVGNAILHEAFITRRLLHLRDGNAYKVLKFEIISPLDHAIISRRNTLRSHNLKLVSFRPLTLRLNNIWWII